MDESLLVIPEVPAQQTVNSTVEGDDRGVLLGAGAYILWGIFPLYFHMLAPASAGEILAHRMIWSLVFCAIAWLVIRDLSWVKDLFAEPRRFFLLVTAAVFLAINWAVYIYAITIGNIVEGSLGYFINPLFLVLMGVFLLHERLRMMQWIAVGVGAVAVLVIAFDYGRPPWIALALALSFSSYGFIKKKVGPGIGALASMTTETVVQAPFALAILIWLETTGRGTFSQHAPWHGLGLVGTGIITAFPLIMFAAAARRVPLTTMGLLQFLTPILQLICGVVVLGERVPATRWIGFGLVWVALVLLTVDSVQAANRRGRVRRAEASASAIP